MGDLNKKRLDAWLVTEGLFRSRYRANVAIKSGQIVINGKKAGKPSQLVASNDRVEVRAGDFGYVGRGALKLKAAVEKFKIALSGKVCLDIGVATGGFSDYLLQNGAAKVYGIDVGKGQISPALLENENFIFRNFTDASKLNAKDFQDKLDLIVIDVSFVSIVKFFATFRNLMDMNTQLIALIKPQFELGQAHSGVIKSESTIGKILADLKLAFQNEGFLIKEELPCPVLGRAGNQEYLWLIKKNTN